MLLESQETRKEELTSVDSTTITVLGLIKYKLHLFYAIFFSLLIIELSAGFKDLVQVLPQINNFNCICF